MVAKDTSYGSETYRPYLDIEKIIDIQSACSVNRGHDLTSFTSTNAELNDFLINDALNDQDISLLPE